VYEVPNLTVHKWIILNQNMLNQSKTCLRKSSCIDKREQSMIKVISMYLNEKQR